jgi:hypothetical protein
MQITITVPELACTRCAVTAPLQPHIVYRKGPVPALLRAAFSDVMKECVVATAVDDAGREWGVLTNSKPAGWVEGPQASDLCAECGALWLDASKAFLVPPPAPIVVEEVNCDSPSDSDSKSKQDAPTPLAALPPATPRQRQRLHGARYR